MKKGLGIFLENCEKTAATGHVHLQQRDQPIIEWIRTCCIFLWLISPLWIC